MFILAEAGEDQTLQIVLSPAMLSIIPMLAVILQVVKGVPFIQKHTAWFPVVDIAIAVFVAVATKMGVTTADQIIAGITMGLATAGGYDVAKIVTKTQKGNLMGTVAAAIISAIGAIASLIAHLFFGKNSDKKSWFKELSILEKGYDNAKQKHMQELASGTSDSVAAAYAEWMQWTDRLGHHRGIGKQKGYIC